MFIRMIQVYVGSDPEVFVWYGMRCMCGMILVTRGLVLKINPN